MKFSSETIGVLKNFASINQGIVFKPGSIIKTMNAQKTIMASARISEEIEGVARVYDLSRFLATLALFDNPNVEFKADKFLISSENSSVTYTYAAESMVVTPPDKDINFPEADINVHIKWKDLDSVIRAAGVLKLSEIAFRSTGDTLYVSAVDSKNSSADVYDVMIASNISSQPFRMLIKVENIKLMPNDYDVALTSKGMAHFKSNKADYYVALEAK